MLNAFSKYLHHAQADKKFFTISLVVVTGLALYLVPPEIVRFFLVLGIQVFDIEISAVESWLDTTEAIFTLTLATEIIVMALIFLLLKFLKQRWRDIGVVRPRWRDLGYVLVGLGIYLVTYMLVAGLLQDRLDFEQRQELGFDTTVYGVNLWLVFISLVVLPPLVEEILFRGFLYTQLKRAFTVVWSAIIISLLFGAAHLQVGSGNPLLWVAAVDTFILSLVLVYLREKTGSIWAGVGLHALKNFIAFMFLFVLKIA